MKTYVIENKMYKAKNKVDALKQVSENVYFVGNEPYIMVWGIYPRKVFCKVANVEYVGKSYSVINNGIINEMTNEEEFNYYCNTSGELLKSKRI